VLEGLLDLVFPPRCAGCARRGALLCERCQRDLPYLRDVCRRCALPRGITANCSGCRRLPEQVASLRAVCAYEGAARAAVQTFKYRGQRGMAAVLGGLMVEHLRVRPLRADMVVPVPLAPKRLRERGYNQAELLAARVATSVGGSLVTDALERDERPRQQGLGAAERLSNLHGSVQARSGLKGQLFCGRRVLLVDDVATTGATLAACAEALVAAGAQDVRALVFARDL
jgi:ComF family protein